MGKSIITITNLGKRYILGAGGGERYRALRDVIMNSVRGLWRRGDKKNDPQELWALRDICFDVEKGETLGIVGRNGAGKTTLLKLLSQITEPTEGEIHLRGRIASLLEVGTGFHPELTGRENIFMNGSILGMSRAEIKKKFDEIVAFSEIEKFLDTPVKRYSNGMYVRLAFAVAAHLDPEILVIDEVLAVGDIKFQKKCIGKMETLKESDRTLLFVSHNMSNVRNLCKKCVWLDNGRIKKIGDTDEVIEAYLSEGENFEAKKVWNDTNAPCRDGIKFKSITIMDASGKPTTNFTTSEPILLESVFELTEELGLANSGYEVYRRGLLLFSAGDVDYCQQEGIRHGKGQHKIVCKIPGNLLNHGEHSIDAFVSSIKGTIRVKEVLSFRVFNDHPREWYGEVRPKVEWKID